jgi:hypothetical protein
LCAGNKTNGPTNLSESAWLSTAAAKCVEWHESTDGKYSSNVWQFQGSTFQSVTGLTGDPSSYSIAIQDAAAYKLFTERSWQPWTADYRVCGL